MYLNVAIWHCFYSVNTQEQTEMIVKVLLPIVVKYTKMTCVVAVLTDLWSYKVLTDWSDRILGVWFSYGVLTDSYNSGVLTDLPDIDWFV